MLEGGIPVEKLSDALQTRAEKPILSARDRAPGSAAVVFSNDGSGSPITAMGTALSLISAGDFVWVANGTYQVTLDDEWVTDGVSIIGESPWGAQLVFQAEDDVSDLVAVDVSGETLLKNLYISVNAITMEYLPILIRTGTVRIENCIIQIQTEPVTPASTPGANTPCILVNPGSGINSFSQIYDVTFVGQGSESIIIAPDGAGSVTHLKIGECVFRRDNTGGDLLTIDSSIGTIAQIQIEQNILKADGDITLEDTLKVNFSDNAVEGILHLDGTDTTCISGNVWNQDIADAVDETGTTDTQFSGNHYNDGSDECSGDAGDDCVQLQCKVIPVGETWTIPADQCLRIYRNLTIPSGSSLVVESGGTFVVDV